MEPVARLDRVQVGRDVQPEREPEYLVLAEALAHRLRRVALEEA
jgi:hypothetical protein